MPSISLSLTPRPLVMPLSRIASAARETIDDDTSMPSLTFFVESSFACSLVISCSGVSPGFGSKRSHVTGARSLAISPRPINNFSVLPVMNSLAFLSALIKSISPIAFIIFGEFLTKSTALLKLLIGWLATYSTIFIGAARPWAVFCVTLKPNSPNLPIPIPRMLVSSSSALIFISRSSFSSFKYSFALRFR